MAQTPEVTGGCLCGAVTYRIVGPMRRVVFCHCTQCRKTSGHFVAATAVRHDQLKLTEESGLAWYRSSDIARRGFCRHCGSSLFWDPSHGEYICIMAGTIDRPTGLTGREHIHTSDASDYYEISDGLPQFEHDHAGLWEGDGK